MLWAASRSQSIITVSAALKAKLVALGVDDSAITVLRNGVDVDMFQEVPRGLARGRLALPDAPLVLSVGNLVPEKGHHLAIDAIAELRNAHLAIVGDGPLREQLRNHADRLGVAARVHFLPVRPQSELKWVYGAADVLVLASSREGWPNVLLESMACGTPVVASDVGGVREIVTEPSAGRIVAERTGVALAESVQAVLDANIPHADTRRFAARYDWTTTAQGQLHVFGGAIAAYREGHTFDGRTAMPKRAGE